MIKEEIQSKFIKLKRRLFQITLNLSLDGVLDALSSKNMTEAGPMNLIDDYDSDIDDGVDKQTQFKACYDLPGAMANRGRPIVTTKCLRIASGSVVGRLQQCKWSLI